MKIEAVTPPKKWQFAAAIALLVYASFRLRDLYESRDFSEDWAGPGLFVTGLLFMRAAFRTSNEKTGG